MQTKRVSRYPLRPLHPKIRFNPRFMLNIPLEADQTAKRAVRERIFPGDLVNKSSTTETVVDFNISGIMDTKVDKRSAFEMEGISCMAVSSTMIKGKADSRIKKDACAA